MYVCILVSVDASASLGTYAYVHMNMCIHTSVNLCIYTCAFIFMQGHPRVCKCL